jgi:hypothetical protein
LGCARTAKLTLRASAMGGASNAGSILTLPGKSTAKWIPAFAGMTTLKLEATARTILGVRCRVAAAHCCTGCSANTPCTGGLQLLVT